MDQPTETVGCTCTVREDPHGRQVIVSLATTPRPKVMPETLLEVLAQWGSTWMWQSLQLVGEDDWLKESADESSAVPTWMEEQAPGATATIVTWLGDVPKEGDDFTYNNNHFIVTKVERRAIIRARIEYPEHEGE